MVLTEHGPKASLSVLACKSTPQRFSAAPRAETPQLAPLACSGCITASTDGSWLSEDNPDRILGQQITPGTIHDSPVTSQCIPIKSPVRFFGNSPERSLEHVAWGEEDGSQVLGQQDSSPSFCQVSWGWSGGRGFLRRRHRPRNPR